MPKEKRLQIIEREHKSLCHVGAYKTFHKIVERYYWRKMRSDITAFVRSCEVCLVVKPEQKPPSGLMLSSQTAISKPFELLCADIVGPLPRTTSGHSFILVVADCFSKFALMCPISSATASEICLLIENNVFLVFGCRRAIIVNNGVQFRSNLFE